MRTVFPVRSNVHSLKGWVWGDSLMECTAQQLASKQLADRKNLSIRINLFGHHWACQVALPRQILALRQTTGSQLLEFALVMPLLLVIAVGITDFGKAYNIKHILTNAAREAARITISNPLKYNAGGCTTSSPPCTIQGAKDAVQQYLTDAGLSTASCLSSATASSPAALTWTYSCSGVSLTIDRSQVIAGGASSSTIPATKITLTYPYVWTFGRLIGLLVNGATATLPASLTTTVIMANIVSSS
jgi:Flp pilus assembly protein TadG